MRSEISNITNNAVRTKSYAVSDARRYLLGAVAPRRRWGALLKALDKSHD